MGRFSAVATKVREHLHDLRVQADALQREGDLEAAAEVLYGELPIFEQAVDVLDRLGGSDTVSLEMLHRSDRQIVFRDLDGRAWAAIPVDHVSFDGPSDIDPTPEDPLRIGIGEALGVNQRKDLLLLRYARAVRHGHIALANSLEEVLASIEEWERRHVVFEVAERTPTQAVLRDEEDVAWVARPLPLPGPVETSEPD